MYADSETKPQYINYNRRFQEWFNSKYNKKKTTVSEKDVREYVSGFVKEGKDTHTLIAALMFRFNYCEKNTFSFKGLSKKSKRKRPHKVITKEKLKKIFIQS